MFSFESLAFVLLIVLVVMSLRSEYSTELLPKANSNCLRGIFALLIIIFHVSKETDVFFPIFNYFSITVVGFFFFISGFGLMKGYLTDRNYRKTFVKKRFVKVLLPYVIMTVVYWFYYAAVGETYSISDVLLRMAKYAPIVMYSWFIISLIVQYVYFYILINLFERNSGLLVTAVAILCLVRIILTFLLNYENPNLFNLYFGIGIIGAAYEKEIQRIISSNRITTLTISFISVLVFHFFTPSIMSKEAFNMIEVLLFIILSLSFSNAFSVNSRFLSYCGVLSMNIYMTQGLSKMIVRRFLGVPLFIQDIAIFVLAFAMSYVFNCCFLFINKTILKQS